MLLLEGSWLGNAIAAVPSGDLALIELKMTGPEMVVIENISAGTINLQNYLLEYFNKTSPTSFAVSTSVQALPNFSLGSHQSFLLTGDSSPTCGAAGIANLSMSLSDSGGYIELVKVSPPDATGSITYTPQDHVNWTSGSGGADLVKVTTAPADSNTVWYRKLSDGTWQQAQIGSDCSLFTTATNVTPAATTSFIQWADGSAPPATIVQDGNNSAGASIPAADIGLAAPQINELLPNPAEPASDDEDEFIELYNSNDRSFDLSGFKLQVGTTTLHNYTFPVGTNLPAHSFVAFYSIDTNLSLSNNGSQARLLDPQDNVMSQSQLYGSAKESQTWALANGAWYWTTQPTPNAANVIRLPIASTTKTKKTIVAKTPSVGKVKSASTSNSLNSNPNDFQPNTTQGSNTHWPIVAIVGSLALLYALYEYRHDLANRLYQFRRHRETRRAARETIETASGY